jgi:hypothetical protein
LADLFFGQLKVAAVIFPNPFDIHIYSAFIMIASRSVFFSLSLCRA